MLNEFMLVGKVQRKTITNDRQMKIKIDSTSEEDRYREGYGHFNIPILLEGELMSHTKDCLDCGDVIGIKGKITVRNHQTLLIAQRISYLSGRNMRGNV